MKLALRFFCLASLLCASWAAVGADDKSKPTGTLPSPVFTPTIAPARSTVKLNGPAAATPSAAVPAGSSIAVLSPPTMTQSPSTPSPAAAPTMTAMQLTPTYTPAASTTTPIAPAPKTSLAPLSAVPNSPTHHDVQLSHGTLQPTPEMWFYEQMRNDYNDPELQARRRGEAHAAERRARLAARQWYGVSNSRPMANVTPFMYYYSPSWGSNTGNAYQWSGRITAPVVVEARRAVVGLTGFGTW